MKRTAVSQLRLELRDEVEHLGLDGRVEAGRGLVEDQQRRVLRERHRDHDALLHAARELVRIAAHHRSRDRRSAPRASASRARSLASPCETPEHGERLGDLRADPHATG